MSDTTSEANGLQTFIDIAASQVISAAEKETDDSLRVPEKPLMTCVDAPTQTTLKRSLLHVHWDFEYEILDLDGSDRIVKTLKSGENDLLLPLTRQYLLINASGQPKLSLPIEDENTEPEDPAKGTDESPYEVWAVKLRNPIEGFVPHSEILSDDFFDRPGKVWAERFRDHRQENAQRESNETVKSRDSALSQLWDEYALGEKTWYFGGSINVARTENESGAAYHCKTPSSKLFLATSPEGADVLSKVITDLMNHLTVGDE